MFESWPELWGGGYPAYRTTLRKFLWFRTVTGGNAPEYETVIGRIVSFITRRAAPLKIEATLTPIQDLHGYDAPWPPGGGVNKFDVTERVQNQTNANGAASSGYTLSNGVLTISKDANYYGRIMLSAMSMASGSYVLSFKAAVSGTGNVWYSVRNMGAAPKVDIVSATGATAGKITVPFTLLADADVAISIQPQNIEVGTVTITEIQIESGSTASDYSPYSNECPISGHTGAEVYDNGENIIPTSVPSNVIAGTFTASSTAIGSATNARVFAIPVPKNTDIHVQKKSGNTSGHAIALGDTGSIAVGTKIYDGYGITNSVDKTYNTGNHSWLYVMSSTLALAESLFTTTEFMVSIGTERKEYVAPVQGTTVTISFGQTVYGGTLTVNEDRTGSVKARPYYASYNGETLVGPWVSSMDAYAPGTTPTTGAQVVDMGGTETTIPLTPGQVNALQGQNVVWVVDSGEIKVTYRSN